MSATARSFRRTNCYCSSGGSRRSAASRCASAEIKADGVLDGRSMIEADLAYQIDNMEGIAVHRNSAGETIVTLVSDDNFSIIQHNLLLQFSVVGE